MRANIFSNLFCFHLATSQNHNGAVGMIATYKNFFEKIKICGIFFATEHVLQKSFIAACLFPLHQQFQWILHIIISLFVVKSKGTVIYQ